MGTINYAVVARKNPQTKQLLYYAQKLTDGSGRLMTADLINSISENSQVARALVPAALAAIQKSINNFVLNGHSITIPRLGCFTPTIRGRMVDTAEEFTSEHIRSVQVRYRMSSELRQQATYGVQFNLAYRAAAPDVGE